MNDEWDDNKFPLAYLLTFRTYGTWHHGDERGSVDRRNYNKFRAADIAPNPELVANEINQRKNEPFLLDSDQRNLIDSAIREVCSYREFTLHALNVRSNHVHAVITGFVKPEKITEAFKSYATRALRNAGAISSDVKIWARHGSTRYLWKERHVGLAIEYVLYGQGDVFPDFDELVG